MTTYPQYTLKSQDVYTFTINTLDTLPLEMPGVLKAGTCCGSWSLLPPPGSRSIRPVTSLNVLRRDRPCWAPWSSQFRDLDALEGHRQ